MLPTFARLVQSRDDARGRIDRAALVISFREGQFLADFATQLRSLRRRGLTVSVLFFEASDEILARRFSETRRPHPLAPNESVPEALRRLQLAQCERMASPGFATFARIIDDTGGMQAPASPAEAYEGPHDRNVCNAAVHRTISSSIARAALSCGSPPVNAPALSNIFV